MRKSAIVLGAAALALSAQVASAQPFKTVDEYLHAAGEVAAGRMECSFAFNMKRLEEYSRPFQVSSPDDPAVEQLAGKVAEQMAAAMSRLQDEGLEYACPRLLNAYGPSGSVAPGILNSPGSE